jgi:serine/threonine-protein kinase
MPESTETLDPVPPDDRTVTRPPTVAPALPGFDDDTRVLLWWRLLELHVAVFGMMVVLGLASARGVLDTPSLRVPPAWSAAVPFIQMLELAFGALFLWRNPNLSLRGLRVVEVVHFGTAAVGNVFDKYLGLAVVDVNASPDPALAIWFTANTSQFGVIMLVMGYGTLIPNPPRRSLIGVGLLAAVPFLTTVAAVVPNPSLGPYLPSLLTICGVQLTLPVLISVFVASRNYALRREAFDARHETQQVGAYTLGRKLGEGGMGEVWVADHRLLKRPCAVKFIRPEFALNPAAAARFEREVRAITALTHFHTVRMYDYGRAADGGFYYVMEYLEGPTLESLVLKGGPLEPARAVYLLRQLCGALAEAHAAGLVHRDLKPGNVIVASLGGQKDVAKLLDFGLVQNTGPGDDVRLTRTGTVLGTPAYMCPEQAGGEPNVDARGDLYSLGAVAFFALTGRPPFDEPSVGKLLTAHLTRTPPRSNELRPEVPDDLAGVVGKCLEKSPSDRFASAVELDRALAACECAADWSSACAAKWWEVNSGNP